MKECTIHLKDGNKEADLSISYKEENELIIVDGIFKFFGINIDYEAVSKQQIAIYKMYADYYADESNYRAANGSAELAETGEMTFADVERHLRSNSFHSEPQEDLPNENPGLKIKGGIPKYRCNYKCPKCGNSGNHYISKTAKIVTCHKCRERLTVHPVNADFMHDVNFNYFVAGLKWEKGYS